MRFKGPFIYQPEFTVATLPLAALADAASQMERDWFIANASQCHAGKARFCYYEDIFRSIKAMQPVTYVKCTASNISSIKKFPKLDQENGAYPLVDYESSTVGSQLWFTQSTDNGSKPSLSWVELPEANFGQTSLGAVVAIPGSEISNRPDQALSCTIDARWFHSNATVSFQGGPNIISGLPNKWFLRGWLHKGSSGEPAWALIKIIVLARRKL